MTIPEFNEIIEQNDQTAARREHLEKLRELVGNCYPNKFARSAISGPEDTITSLLDFGPITDVLAEIKEVVATLAERERPPAEVKDSLNEHLKELGTVRISGRLAVISACAFSRKELRAGRDTWRQCGARSELRSREEC